MILFLFIMMMVDFLLTYYGINILGVIAEGNYFMVWLFNLPFINAFLIRLISVSIVIGVISYIKKIEHRWYPLLINTGLLTNLFIMILHFNWILREMI